MLTVVFADQTFATVLEATRIRTAIGPSQAWYTENLRYYYLILPTVDGSLSRRFGFLITALCLFTSMFIMLRRKRVPGVARGPAWRLMGVIFGTMFFLMFTPTKWVHHFGLFAAVGAAMAALATVLVSPTVLRWSRNRMTFLAAVLFVLALCFATTNGWWYVSSYGVPFNNAMPKIGGITVSTIFFALVRDRRDLRVWLHFASRDRGEGRIARALTAAPIPLAAGFMVVVFVGVDGRRRGAPVPDLLQRVGQPARLHRRLRSGRRRARRTRHQRRLPDAAARRLRPARPARRRRSRSGFTPNGVPEQIVAEAIRHEPADAGHRLRLGPADQAQDARASTGRPCRCRTASTPRGFRWRARYVEGPQQQSTLDLGVVSAAAARRRASRLWSSPPRAPSPATACSTGDTDGQTVELEYARPGPDGAPGSRGQAGALRPRAASRRGATCGSPARQIPADAVAVRVVAEDLSLTPGDWIAVTPPRVPELRSVQEYVGSQQPVLMDWAVGLAFPCQQPMLHANGVTEIPKFRITPDYNAKSRTPTPGRTASTAACSASPTCCCGQHVMATYLSHDWGRDWGSLRKFDTIVDAQPAQLDLGTATRSGLWKPGKIRIGTTVSVADRIRLGNAALTRVVELQVDSSAADGLPADAADGVAGAGRRVHADVLGRRRAGASQCRPGSSRSTG